MNEVTLMSFPRLLPHSIAATNANKLNIRVCVLMTSFNRRAYTLKCLSFLASNQNLENISLSAVLVDDGSTDGTGEAVKKEFPWVEVVQGDGSLFWCRGMFKAFQIAQQGSYDFYLWLNDDTHLKLDAIAKLLSTYTDFSKKTGRPVVVVGATADNISGKLTYGGQVATSRLRPFTFRKVWSETDAVECETMNGNVVLIPAEIAKAVGNLDPVFEHAMGDIDYGLRVRQAGYKLIVASGFVGHCSNNSNVGTYLDETLPFGNRWKKMLSRKGLPVKSWLQLTRRHGGFIWPLYFAWPYLQVACQGLISLIRKKTHTNEGHFGN